jgi:hypothetical protein
MGENLPPRRRVWGSNLRRKIPVDTPKYGCAVRGTKKGRCELQYYRFFVFVVGAVVIAFSSQSYFFNQLTIFFSFIINQ